MSFLCLKLFHDGGCYHIETSPLICGANQWTGFYMITASIVKELKELQNCNQKFIFVTAAKISENVTNFLKCFF